MSIIVNTSADDLRSSLKLINPKTGFEIRECTEMLNKNLDYEVKNRNRASVTGMLKSKINQVKKLRPGR